MSEVNCSSVFLTVSTTGLDSVTDLESVTTGASGNAVLSVLVVTTVGILVDLSDLSKVSEITVVGTVFKTFLSSSFFSICETGVVICVGAGVGVFTVFACEFSLFLVSIGASITGASTVTFLSVSTFGFTDLLLETSLFCLLKPLKI